jgi:hypothetical protein
VGQPGSTRGYQFLQTKRTSLAVFFPPRISLYQRSVNLPFPKSAYEPSAIIYSRNRTNSIVARARIPLRVMTLPKILCNA